MNDPNVIWTAHHLATLRRAILTVIDDGDMWSFYESSVMGCNVSEEEATDQRMDFVDAVQLYITREVTES